MTTNYIEFTDLPVQIQKKLLERQAEQNDGLYRPEVFKNKINAGKASEGVDWSSTPEKDKFWRSVLMGDYDVFYSKYTKSAYVHFNDLPKCIQDKMVDRQAEQRNGIKDPRVFKNNITSGETEGGFHWGSTPEKHNFWSKVLRGDINHYYTLYPIDPPTLTLDELPKHTIKGLICEYTVFSEKYLSKLLGDDYEWKAPKEDVDSYIFLVQRLRLKAETIKVHDYHAHMQLVGAIKYMECSYADAMMILSCIGIGDENY
jgi:hypothetical protein